MTIFNQIAKSNLIRLTTKGRPQWKKNVFFRALPESLNPPPDPNLGNLALFFYVKNDEKKFDADNEGCNDIYDDNYGNFDDNYDKND